jgi:hypothetical protein
MGFSVLHESNKTWPIEANKGICIFEDNKTWFDNYDGIIGWKWALLTPQYAATFPVQFHLVRDPLMAIQSAMTHSDSLFKNVEKHLGYPESIPPNADKKLIKLTRAINYWIRYNEVIGKNKCILQVETFKPQGKSLTLFCEKTNSSLSAGSLISQLPTNINTRQTRFPFARLKRSRFKLTWALLEKHFPKELKTLDKMKALYGYN